MKRGMRRKEGKEEKKKRESKGLNIIWILGLNSPRIELIRNEIYVGINAPPYKQAHIIIRLQERVNPSIIETFPQSFTLMPQQGLLHMNRIDNLNR